MNLCKILGGNLMKKFIMDVYCYILISGYVYSIFKENVEEVSKKNIKYLGILDYGFNMLGGLYLFYFYNLYLFLCEV